MHLRPPVRLNTAGLSRGRNLFRGCSKLDAEMIEQLDGEAAFLPQQAEEKMLRTNMAMDHALGFFGALGQDSLDCLAHGKVDAGRT
jgi:hypothetical protein